MLINQCKFRLLSGNPTFGQVLTSPLDWPILVENRVNVVTDCIQIVYCLLNEIISVVLLNVLIRGLSVKTKYKIINEVETRKSKTEAVLQRRSMLKLGVICKFMKRFGKCFMS